MRDRLIELLNNTFDEQYGKRGLLTAPHTADALLAEGVIVPPKKGCEYCKGRAYTKKPLAVITKYGRRIELAFEFCPNCGRKMNTREEAEAALKEREGKV